MTFDQLTFDNGGALAPQEYPIDPLRLGICELIEMFGYDEVARMVRMLEPTVEVASAPARWTDPETSQMAAKKEKDVGRFSDKSRQAKLLHAFSASDLTDQQAAARVVGAHAAISAFEGCRRRCSDLRAVHFIADSGGLRRNAGSDNDSIIWSLTEGGTPGADQPRRDRLVAWLSQYA